MDQKTYSFYIAGVKHYDAHKLHQTLSVGDDLELSADPENKFDPNAIEIYYDFEYKLGFVPAIIAKEIKESGKTAANFTATVVSVDFSEVPHRQIKVELTPDVP